MKRIVIIFSILVAAALVVVISTGVLGQGDGVQINSVVSPGVLDDESVLIVNESDEPVNLKGWILESNNTAPYKFGDMMLFAGSSTWVYSKAGEDTTISLFQGLSSPMLSTGGTLSLTNPSGEVVSIIEVERPFNQNDPIDTPTLEEQISALSARVSALETVVAGLNQPLRPEGTPIAEESPATIPPSSDPVDFEILSIDAKITETNNVWWKYAWILKLKNQSNKDLVFNATVEFLDVDGFIVDDDIAYNLPVSAGETQTFTGYALINADVAADVNNVAVKVLVGQ